MADPWDRITGFCCSTCMYCAPKDEVYGRCRRNAPTMAGYPTVYLEHDWCGEHKIGTNPSKKTSENELLDSLEKNQIECRLHLQDAPDML